MTDPVAFQLAGLLGILPEDQMEPEWPSTESKSASENAQAHWEKHRAEFPEYQNRQEYVEGARNFVKSPPEGTLTKMRNGDTLFYDPKTNTFAVRGPNGAPRTMFRPAQGIAYWNRQ